MSTTTFKCLGILNCTWEFVPPTHPEHIISLWSVLFIHYFKCLGLLVCIYLTVCLSSLSCYLISSQLYYTGCLNISHASWFTLILCSLLCIKFHPCFCFFFCLCMYIALLCSFVLFNLNYYYFCTPQCNLL